eukprot:CAMPEP_0171286894 /NCGR_PEP_ID=MMETSP0790-20130122/69260_1 /TAXON_ID=2925 /ORGANISM="Alexandrium catenella, Strain OF101" /LENGTH=45 /DNA_ID= /DNA_START= /DNA_END= /DNA_ORIENTATION=
MSWRRLAARTRHAQRASSLNIWALAEANVSGELASKSQSCSGSLG